MKQCVPHHSVYVAIFAIESTEHKTEIAVENLVYVSGITARIL